MKLKQILYTIIATIASLFIISIALDSDWVAAQISRQLIIYVTMLALAFLGYAVIREILKTE